MDRLGADALLVYGSCFMRLTRRANIERDVTYESYRFLITLLAATSLG